MDVTAAPAGSARRSPWILAILGLIPLALLALALLLFGRFGPAGVLTAAFPPVEELTVERLTFGDYGIRAEVVNAGPEPVTVAQVSVDDAIWKFSIEPNATIPRLGRATVTVHYPWVAGEPHAVALISSTGIAFTGEAPVAARTPVPDATFLTTFALLGVYAGVIPVAIGLVWFPFLRRLSERWLNFFLSLTVGLLLFLGVDTTNEAIETAGGVPGAFQGIALAGIGFILAWLAVTVVDRWRASQGATGPRGALVLAYAIAVGIGLHNLGEGLAIGAAFATGAMSLGTFLVIGFATHNTTEGLAIAAPLARRQAALRDLVPHLIALGAIAGVPTIIGAWIGGFSFSPVLSTLFLAVGAGAIFQVAWQIARSMGGGPAGSLAAGLNALGLAAGLLIMYATGLLIVS